MPSFALLCHTGAGLVEREAVVGKYTFCPKAVPEAKNDKAYSKGSAFFIVLKFVYQ
jgi:hypothetical protein